MIRVIIEREIVPGLEQFYEKAIAKLLNTMSSWPGYVAGVSLVDIRKPNHYVVVARWVDEAAWTSWSISLERQQMHDVIKPFLQTDEKFTLLSELMFHQDAAVN